MVRRTWYLFFLLLLIVMMFPVPGYADGFPIVGTLHSGKRPEAMAVDTQTHLLYIAHEASGVVVAFDPVRGNVRWRNTLGDVATDVQVDSVSHHVYVTATSYGSKKSDLFILDGATGGILSTLPTGPGDNGIALDRKRHQAFVSSGDDGVVYVFTLQSGWQSGPIRATTSQLHIGPHPQGLGVNSRLGRLYVTDTAEHKLFIVDEQSLHTLTTLPLANAPLHPLRVDETTGRVYIVCSSGQELDVVDGNKNQMIARVPVKPHPEGIAFNTATGRIYVADEGSNEGSQSERDSGTTITVIDGKTFDVLGTMQVGKAPDGVESDPALRRVYVALEDSDAVVEVSDSIDLPLKVDTTLRQAVAARRAVFLLQQAAIITLVVMLLTVAWATLSALSPRWRARESPRIQQGDVSSRSEMHSLPR